MRIADAQSECKLDFFNWRIKGGGTETKSESETRCQGGMAVDPQAQAACKWRQWQQRQLCLVEVPQCHLLLWLLQQLLHQCKSMRPIATYIGAMLAFLIENRESRVENLQLRNGEVSSRARRSFRCPPAVPEEEEGKTRRKEKNEHHYN